MSHKINLLIIDPQRSFCAGEKQGIPSDPSKQQKLHDGELCVPGAWDDMVRVGDMVSRLAQKISDVKVTLDSHHQLHIAHPCWFTNAKTGEYASPFTAIRLEGDRILGAAMDTNGQFADVGEFNTPFRAWTLEYLKALTDSKRYGHFIWPYHCLIGTRGHQIVEPLAQALLDWELVGRPGYVDIVTKGSDPRVEHFSAVRAEVVNPKNPEGTGLNSEFITTLVECDEILLTGEALSHCLANTVRDVANEFAGGSLGTQDEFIKKCVLLTDASSSVPGFEKVGESFIKDMKARGMRTTTTVDYLA